ncbi:ACT domain-containing protein [Psychrosphaera ytuae]|uniref:ACT domain-containing protein n=1 Tax=Psychrosphaera ytuae TaxID=2820710 RepID=A0A975HKH8_9GAMM|nr:ACT domain-containing protein [Psychrosphaera ytuae]QTH64334.1 ACT domain-containing protein [Psychrosphaera ytuae]
MPKQTLQHLEAPLTIHSMAPNSPIPVEVTQAELFFIAKTSDELSIVCPSDIDIDSDESESGWQTLEVLGPLGFSLTGIMSNISGVLAAANISIFAVSTFDTDYILVKDDSIEAAVKALRKSSYKVLSDSY